MANSEELIGRCVIVRTNDFVDAPLHAYVRFVDPITKSLLLEFDPPYEAAGVRYGRAVASARLERDNLDSLINFGVLGSAVTWIPDFQYKPDLPFDLSWWRGGAAAITDVVLPSR